MKYRLYFNHRRQYLIVHVDDPPRAFKRKNNCHAYYIPADVRYKRSGLFGHIHLPLVDDGDYFRELVSHEIAHAVDDWWTCRKGNVLGVQNEEIRATIAGEMNANFWRGWEYNK